MAKDFMKWRMRTSLRLLGIPQRKNRTVTRMKGTRCPAGKSRGVAATTTGREPEACGAMDGDAVTSSVFEFIGSITVYATSSGMTTIFRSEERRVGKEC